MSPVLALPHLIDGSDFYREQFGKLFRRGVRVRFNEKNLIGCKLGARILFSATVRSVRNPVGLVLFAGSPAKMVGIDARRMVARMAGLVQRGWRLAMGLSANPVAGAGVSAIPVDQQVPVFCSQRPHDALVGVAGNRSIYKVLKHSGRGAFANVVPTLPVIIVDSTEATASVASVAPLNGTDRDSASATSRPIAIRKGLSIMRLALPAQLGGLAAILNRTYRLISHGAPPMGSAVRRGFECFNTPRAARIYQNQWCLQ